MNVILIATVILGGVGIVGAGLLYVVSRRFHVYEDPRVAEIEALLPGANCGGCGRSGCHDFARTCAAATSLEGLTCPGAGDAVMKQIAKIVGLAADEAKPRVAVIKCDGACQNRPAPRVSYDGARSCAVAAAVSAGDSGCPSGCLGCGDCVAACKWGAMHIDPETGMPVIDQDRCTGCGACLKACPRHIIELRPKGPRGMRVWVACSNVQRGADAMKVCNVSCIGCMKCVKVCTHDAVKVENNLAYIDADKCKLCRKCEEACPRGAILTANFPIRKLQETAAK